MNAKFILLQRQRASGSTELKLADALAARLPGEITIASLREGMNHEATRLAQERAKENRSEVVEWLAKKATEFEVQDVEGKGAHDGEVVVDIVLLSPPASPA